MAAGTDDTIKNYIENLKALENAFQSQAVVQTEITVLHLAESIKDLGNLICFHCPFLWNN